MRSNKKDHITFPSTSISNFELMKTGFTCSPVKSPFTGFNLYNKNTVMLNRSVIFLTKEIMVKRVRSWYSWDKVRFFISGCINRNILQAIVSVYIVSLPCIKTYKLLNITYLTSVPKLLVASSSKNQYHVIWKTQNEWLK